MIDSIGVIYIKNNTVLSWLIRLYAVVMITRQHNDMIDCIGVIYAETKIELSGLI